MDEVDIYNEVDQDSDTHVKPEDLEFDDEVDDPVTNSPKIFSRYHHPFESLGSSNK